VPISLTGLDVLRRWEGCRLRAYLDSASIYTIGWGATRLADGRRVQKGDEITQDEADRLLAQQVARFAEDVDSLTVDTIAQHQLDALAIFAFNVGIVAYRGSTLRQRVNANPHDPSIRDQFMRWHKAKGLPVYGLWCRRHDEADLYFGVSTPCPPPPFPRRPLRS